MIMTTQEVKWLQDNAGAMHHLTQRIQDRCYDQPDPESIVDLALNIAGLNDMFKDGEEDSISDFTYHGLGWTRASEDYPGAYLLSFLVCGVRYIGPVNPKTGALITIYNNADKFGTHLSSLSYSQVANGKTPYCRKDLRDCYRDLGLDMNDPRHRIAGV